LDSCQTFFLGVPVATLNELYVVLPTLSHFCAMEAFAQHLNSQGL